MLIEFKQNKLKLIEKKFEVKNRLKLCLMRCINRWRFVKCVFVFTNTKCLCFVFVSLDIGNGWACFVVSISLIGFLTAIIGDVAQGLGCTVGLKDSINAITFVAVGTSLPGLYTKIEIGENIVVSYLLFLFNFLFFYPSFFTILDLFQILACLDLHNHIYIFIVGRICLRQSQYVIKYNTYFRMPQTNRVTVYPIWCSSFGTIFYIASN